ncbi:DUF885 domain-containing protein [Niveispirillum sp. KHB5.9]|uniref:DUF885 domain-containing protein n=1 Tax=Niveispirillum sp. KHB5.9 TaxID=3400269 RepID=UPI003A851A3A
MAPPRIALLFLALLMLVPVAGAEDWRDLSADYSRYLARTDPLAAGQRGDHAAASRWPDDSPAAMATRQRELAAFRQRLDGVAPGSLSETDALSHAIMRRQVDIALESLGFDEARIPFQDGEGFYTLPETQAAMTVLNGREGAEAWLARIASIPAYFDMHTENMRRGMRDRFTQPAQTVEKAARVLRGLATEPPQDSALLLPFANLPAGEPAAAWRARAVALIRDKVRPAQARLADFFQQDYLPRARASLGAGSLDKGRYYSFQIRRYTTLTLEPAAIHAMGQAEITRIKGEMARLLADSSFTGSARDYLLALRADPANRAIDADDYGRRAAEIAKRAEYLLPRYFGTLPRLPYGVRQKPAGLDSISSGYLPGSPETRVAGAVIYGGGAGNDLAGLPAWLLHEGVPGHHLQIALAQENRDLPDYRRLDDVTAFVEGWALYAERLGEEMGIYRSVAERMGRLSMEAWRACRLVMDTGLHAMDWTRDQATSCLLENTGMSRDGAYRETDRYIGWPGQALGYKLGEMRIVALRREAEERMGSRFDLRAFHDLLLSAGALPLDLLEQRVRGKTATP